MVSNPFRSATRFPAVFSSKKSLILLAFGALLLLQVNSFLFFRQTGEGNSTSQSADAINPKTIKSKSSSQSSDKWDSSKSAVMGLATGYNLDVYKRFVGSLRATGYPGHIILGIAKNAPDDVLDYLAQQNVTAKVVEMADKCTYNGTIGNEGTPINMKGWHCAKAYPDYKITWGRFPLYKDWLHECPTCTDGVIVTDVRDAFFQRDPFQTETKPQPLMLFEEHANLTNTNWLTDFPVTSCKNYTVGAVPMLCSGSVMGTRQGILDYIDVMIEEFDVWKEKEKCRIDMVGDDQSIHNYLYYTNRFKNAVAIPYRTGPIHVVGFPAARIFEKATKEAKEQGVDFLGNNQFYVKDDKWQEWLPKEYDLIDPNTGLIVNKDGSPSAQVHQNDRFGQLMSFWFGKMEKEGWPYNK